MKKKISILIPVFNEEQNVEVISREIHLLFQELAFDYEILFVNDGSSDNSLAILKQIAEGSNSIKYISFSRNFGKDNALLAGFQYANGDALITIDADLQHPIELIPEMLALWQKGNEVVYAYREDRNKHASNFNQLTSKIFYHIINNLSDIELEDGISDYRLLDRKVINSLNTLHEDRPFFRGLVKWVGFQQIGIPYTPKARKFGESKYSNKELLRLALVGITSFSIKPLLIAIYLGFVFSLLSILYIPYVIISLYNGWAISGWTSIIVTIAFFGGIQLMILGIIGLYLGKLFMQSKQRPHFIIRESNLVL
ncbi:MAG: glycosyltransferase family 2 protein [Chitinophagaceae bacterium]|nr:glycosyltransferase family 2 protein [Chitinophagaceae bacterium]